VAVAVSVAVGDVKSEAGTGVTTTTLISVVVEVPSSAATLVVAAAAGGGVGAGATAVGVVVGAAGGGGGVDELDTTTGGATGVTVGVVVSTDEAGVAVVDCACLTGLLAVGVVAGGVGVEIGVGVDVVKVDSTSPMMSWMPLATLFAIFLATSNGFGRGGGAGSPGRAYSSISESPMEKTFSLTGRLRPRPMIPQCERERI
jgi:hypothetical protein